MAVDQHVKNDSLLRVMGCPNPTSGYPPDSLKFLHRGALLKEMLLVETIEKFLHSYHLDKMQGHKAFAKNASREFRRNL